jgi:fermentation-respiration switch protein FrsA (DUF1100 family)
VRGSGDVLPPPQVTAISGSSPAVCFLGQPHAHAVRFWVSPTHALDAATSGSGQVGVVLAHQLDANLCQWADYADFLAGHHYRVLAFSFSGELGAGAPRDDDSVVAAARTLRRLGARRIVLMGASRGGAAVLGAVAKTTADGLIALSPPTSMETSDGFAGIRRSPAPLLIAVGQLDSGFVTDALTLYKQAVAKHKTLIVKKGSAAHGVDLLAYKPKGLVDRAVLELLAGLRAR